MIVFRDHACSYPNRIKIIQPEKTEITLLGDSTTAAPTPSLPTAPSFTFGGTGSSFGSLTQPSTGQTASNAATSSAPFTFGGVGITQPAGSSQQTSNKAGQPGALGATSIFGTQPQAPAKPPQAVSTAPSITPTYGATGQMLGTTTAKTTSSFTFGGKYPTALISFTAVFVNCDSRIYKSM